MPIGRNEFRDRPPREELTSLGAIVRDWQWRFPRDRRDMVVEYCREAPNLGVAIRRACLSRAADGKMHNHQTRVRHTARVEFGRRLWEQRGDWLLSMDVVGGFYDEGKRFDALFDYVHHKPNNVIPSGIGPVTAYDVLTRIGAHPSVRADPSSLYLHAGCRQGWLALAPEPGRWERAERVLRREMPAELQDMPADEIEDMCCTYRLIYGGLADRGEWPQ